MVNLVALCGSMEYRSGCMSFSMLFAHTGCRLPQSMRNILRCVYPTALRPPANKCSPPDALVFQYFEEIAGDIGFVCDVLNDCPVSDSAAAREIVRAYDLYLRDLIGQWNAVAEQSLNNVLREAPPGPSDIPKPWICQSRCSRIYLSVQSSSCLLTPHGCHFHAGNSLGCVMRLSSSSFPLVFPM
jgi:hypothetical protein